MTARIDKILAVGAAIMLCISSYFCGVRVINGNDTSFAEILLFHREIVSQFSYEMIIGLEYGDWYYFLMPICISVSAIPILCRELRTGYYKFVKLRSGDRDFVRSTLITNMLAGLMVFILSTGIFRFSIFLILGGKLGEVIFFQPNVIAYNILYLLMISGISILVSVITTDVYLSVTASFMINYMIYSRDFKCWEIAAFTVILYFAAAQILKKRWLKC